MTADKYGSPPHPCWGRKSQRSCWGERRGRGGEEERRGRGGEEEGRKGEEGREERMEKGITWNLQNFNRALLTKSCASSSSELMRMRTSCTGFFGKI